MTPLGTTSSASTLPYDRLRLVRAAAADPSRVAGATHNFYRYPARFSPSFVRAAIEAYTSAGDIVVDPFMGGATTMVESLLLGRRGIGSDINALSVFIARVKTTPLSVAQLRSVGDWSDEVVPNLRFHDELDFGALADDARLHNLSIPRARALKKMIALAIESLSEFQDPITRRFIRCALLATGQWALNGRRNAVTCADFRVALQSRIRRMLAEISAFAHTLAGVTTYKPRLARCAVEHLSSSTVFADGEKATLVVTSPPYPGIHMLYHRWQVDGRKETPAPYWITQTRDGQGSAYYNLGGRRDPRSADYFANLAVGLSSIRQIMKAGATMVQLVAFAKPRRDMDRYLSAMADAGFVEVRPDCGSSGGSVRRLWRDVPNRAWHASRKGATASSREVVLVHEAR